MKGIKLPYGANKQDAEEIKEQTTQLVNCLRPEPCYTKGETPMAIMAKILGLKTRIVIECNKPALDEAPDIFIKDLVRELVIDMDMDLEEERDLRKAAKWLARSKEIFAALEKEMAHPEKWVMGDERPLVYRSSVVAHRGIIDLAEAGRQNNFKVTLDEVQRHQSHVMVVWAGVPVALVSVPHITALKHAFSKAVKEVMKVKELPVTTDAIPILLEFYPCPMPQVKAVMHSVVSLYSVVCKIRERCYTLIPDFQVSGLMAEEEDLLEGRM